MRLAGHPRRRPSERDRTIASHPAEGHLGLLLEAKQRGLIHDVMPLLDRLQEFRFRLAPHTRAAVLKLAGEA